MSSNTLPSLLFLIVDQLNVHESEVASETPLRGTYLMNESDLTAVVTRAQEEFGVEISAGELEALDTVGDLAAFISAAVE